VLFLSHTVIRRNKGSLITPTQTQCLHCSHRMHSHFSSLSNTAQAGRESSSLPSSIQGLYC